MFIFVFLLKFSAMFGLLVSVRSTFFFHCFRWPYAEPALGAESLGTLSLVTQYYLIVGVGSCFWGMDGKRWSLV